MEDHLPSPWVPAIEGYEATFEFRMRSSKLFWIVEERSR